MRMSALAEQTVYRTSSLYAAAFLLAKGLPLVAASHDTRGRVTFGIGGTSEEVEDFLAAYRSGVVEVNAQRFTAEIKRLKGLVHGVD